MFKQKAKTLFTNTYLAKNIFLICNSDQISLSLKDEKKIENVLKVIRPYVKKKIKRTETSEVS